LRLLARRRLGGSRWRGWLLDCRRSGPWRLLRRRSLGGRWRCRMRGLTGWGLRLRRRGHVRGLPRWCLCCGGRRTRALLLLLWNGLRRWRRRAAGRRVGGRGMLAGRPLGRRALSRALSGGALVFVVGRHSGLREANSLRGRRKRQGRRCHDEQNCGAKQKGIASHSILARKLCEVVQRDQMRRPVRRHVFVIRRDHATWRTEGDLCKRRQPDKTAASPLAWTESPPASNCPKPANVYNVLSLEFVPHNPDSAEPAL